MENSVDIKELNLSRAIKEVIEAILRGSAKCLDNELHWCIKSSKKDVSSEKRSWFYVQISSSVVFRKETFKDFSTSSALYEILRCMQKLEDESHLCLQTAGDGVKNSVHLVLNGDTLEILKEVNMPKTVRYSTLYLRVNQPLLHVMEHCTDIHNYLMQLKVFRPKWNIVFSMRLGDVQSRNVYRIERWGSVSEYLPPMVTDGKYYIQNHLFQTSGACFSACYRLPSSLGVNKQIYEGSHQKIEIDLSVITHVIPLQSESRCILTVNVYGPECIPLEVEESKLIKILGIIDWKRMGFEMGTTGIGEKAPFPSSALVTLTPVRENFITTCVISVFLVLETVNDIPQGRSQEYHNLECVLEQHCHKVVQCMELSLQEVLSQLHEKFKAKSIIQRRIQSICKAVTDIVTLSDNEEFRRNMLTCMQVVDTVDLGINLETRLTRMSKQKHHGMWMKETQTDPIYENIENNNLLSEINIRNKKTKPVDKEILAEPQILDTSKPMNEECDMNNSQEETQARNSIAHKMSPFHKLAESDAESDPDTVELGVCVSGNSERDYTFGDETPEQAQITESMKELSPFEELCESDITEHHFSDTMSEEPHHLDQFMLRWTDLSQNRLYDIANIKAAHGEVEHSMQCLSFDKLDSTFTSERNKEAPGSNSYDLKSSVDDKTIPANLLRADFALLQHEDFQSTLNEVTGFNDKGDSIYGNFEDNINTNNNCPSIEKLSVGNQINTNQCEEDSEDWFDEVMVDVENWLN